MALYSDFIRDYPKRCSTVLNECYSHAKSQGFEVTLMLAMASTGLIVPFERLRKHHKGNPQHPSQDRANFSEAANKLDALMNEPFWGSTLWPKSTGSWCRGKLSLSSVEDYPRNPERWKELDGAIRVPDSILLESIVPNIRNALAHGNVVVQAVNNIYSEQNERPIEAIIFLKEDLDKEKKRVGYTFLVCSPDDFRDFLSAWFNFVGGLALEPEVTLEFIRFDYIESEAAD